jgi:methylmalonyl-CoA/ethylmalonyl-CoA epimerase
MLPTFQTHHIGVVVKDIARSLDGYIAHLGYEVRSGLIHDPVQTAYVQFLALPGETILLELIAPDGPESRLANALRSGGGINHICYSVPSMDEAMAALRERRFVTIHAPQPAVAFNGRPIAWMMNRDHLLVELVEQGAAGEL